jgi:hypothetical protein
VLIDGAGQFPVAARVGDSLAVMAYRGRGQHVSLDGRIDLDVLGSQLALGSRISPGSLDSPLDDRNPALFAYSRARWVLAYSELNPGGPNGTFDANAATYRLRVTTTVDSGTTWSSPVTPAIAPLDTLLTSPYGKMLELGDGTLLMSVYTGVGSVSNYPSWRPAILASGDQGRSWSVHALLPRGHNETALLWLGGDTLFAVMRAGTNNLATTLSFDLGRTWFAPTPVTGINQVPGDIILLRNGEILVVYGGRSDPKGIFYRRIRRAGLRLGVSREVTAASIGVPGIDFGYPTIAALLEDDRVALLYYVSEGTRTSLHLAVFCPSAPR